MSKFNIGDTVRFKDGLVECDVYGGITYFDNMKRELVGGKGKITYISDNGNVEISKYKNFQWTVSEDMLELVDDSDSDNNNGDNLTVEKLINILQRIDNQSAKVYFCDSDSFTCENPDLYPINVVDEVREDGQDTIRLSFVERLGY